MPKSTKDLSPDSTYLKAYVLGAYATGKSVFASTFPTLGYVFDFDQGITTYRGLDWEYDTIPLTWKGWIEFERSIKEVKSKVDKGEYKTVVVDSTTAMTDCAMARALQIDPKRSPEGGPIWNVHYQIVKNLMEPKLREIVSWPCNVVYTGHWDIKTDPSNGDIISIDPLLTGQLSQKLPGYFDEVLAAFATQREGKTKYILRTTAWGHYRARSRFSGKLNLLPPIIENDYAAYMKHVKDGIEKTKQNNTEKGK